MTTHDATRRRTTLGLLATVAAAAGPRYAGRAAIDRRWTFRMAAA